MEQDDEFAPGNDADYFIEDDDEGGRFYGGGLTDTQKRILEVMNRDGEEGEDKVSSEGKRDSNPSDVLF